MENQLSQSDAKSPAQISLEITLLHLSAYCTYRVCKSMGLMRFSHRPTYMVHYRTKEQVKEVYDQLRKGTIYAGIGI